MTSIFSTLRVAALGTALLAGTGITGLAYAANSAAPVKLLTAKFEPRQVVQVEVGDFHFLPGQVAPVHTHDAPAIGYVAKGSILYQVEGEKPQILNEGDAFYEPAGPKILRFDNASATEEAIFIDFNLEQEGEPFIVFEEQPTEAIDRRGLPTIDLVDQVVEQADIYSNDIAAGSSVTLGQGQPTLGLVAEGVVELRVKAGAVQRLVAGQSFEVPVDLAALTVTNASSEVPAKVITFVLR